MPTGDLNSYLFFIGKTIQDESGRNVGQASSFIVTPLGVVESVLVQRGDGEFNIYPSANIRFSENNLVLVSPNRARAAILCEQLAQLWKKYSVLKTLKDKEAIDPETHAEFQQQYDESLDQLRGEARRILVELEKRIEECTRQLKSLHISLTDMEIAHGVGELNSSAYDACIATLKRGIAIFIAERQDLVKVRNELQELAEGTMEAIAPKIVNVSLVEGTEPA